MGSSCNKYLSLMRSGLVHLRYTNIKFSRGMSWIVFLVSSWSVTPHSDFLVCCTKCESGYYNYIAQWGALVGRSAPLLLSVYDWNHVMSHWMMQTESETALRNSFYCIVGVEPIRGFFNFATPYRRSNFEVNLSLVKFIGISFVWSANLKTTFDYDTWWINKMSDQQHLKYVWRQHSLHTLRLCWPESLSVCRRA